MNVVIDGITYHPAPKATRHTSLAALFIHHRKRCRLSLEKVAILAELSPSAVHGAESGSTPHLLTAAKLARVYGISMDEIAVTLLGE